MLIASKIYLEAAFEKCIKFIQINAMILYKPICHSPNTSY